MGTIDKFPELIKLVKNKKYAPTRIAKELGTDKRTVDKMIEAGTKLNMLKCETVELSGRKFMGCTLSKEFKKVIEKIE